MKKTAMFKSSEVHVGEEGYQSECGLSMQREVGEIPDIPEANPIGGRWVLRDATGLVIDYDAFRYDLAERNNLSIHGFTEDK